MVEKYDPIKKAEKDSITPDFLNRKSSGKDKRENAASALAGAENAAEKSSAFGGKPSNKKASGGLYTGGGLSGRFGKKSKGKLQVKKGPALAVVAVVVIVMFVIVPSIPFVAIGTIDYNLQKSLGFSGTIGIVEKAASYVVSEMMSKGNFPSKLATDFADSGIVVGQVTESGNFVRTNQYVANIDDTFEVAATGFDFHRYGSEGELEVLYNGRVIAANEFAEVLESDSEMYLDYTEALKAGTKLMYEDKDVQHVYDDVIEANRASFYDWTNSGDNEEDEKNYYEIIDKILEDDVSATIAGCDDNSDDGCNVVDFDSGHTDSILDDVKSATNDTKKSAQLLNMAISSTEPKKAAKAFLAIEEPIQRARINGDGPINPVMNSLNRKVEISYTDVNTNEEVTENKSILETTNFVAAISEGHYSTEEANNFSRDRVLVATDTQSYDGMGDVISDSTLDDKAKSSPSSVLKKGGDGANGDVVDLAKNSIGNATMKLDNERFTSMVGANMAIAGGSYLSNAISSAALGAMPSDAEYVARYQQEVDEVLARKANAERATLSPFDISSPNTFLGNIANKVASAYLNHSSRNDSGFISVVGTMADLTNNSAGNLLGNATADGSDGQFTTIAGDCSTVKQAANVEGDLYCNSHNTITTKYIDYTWEQWKDALGDNITNDGRPESDTDFAEYVTYGTDREATVGVKSATVCEAKKEKDGDGTIIEQFVGLVKVLLGAYKACVNVDDDIATGAAYTLSESNGNVADIELYSGYVLYDKVYALVNDSQSKVSLFREEYYKENPKDESPAGKIARMSGMTKAEAEVALGYASYLARIRNYDPSQRFAFGGSTLKIEQPELLVDDTNIKETLYCYWQGKTEYSDLRNRSQIA